MNPNPYGIFVCNFLKEAEYDPCMSEVRIVFDVGFFGSWQGAQAVAGLASFHAWLDPEFEMLSDHVDVTDNVLALRPNGGTDFTTEDLVRFERMLNRIGKKTLESLEQLGGIK